MKSLVTVLMVIIGLSIDVVAQWYVKNPSPSANNLLAISFVNQNTGWLTGGGGTVLKTENGGKTWTLKTLSTTSIVWDVQFVDENIGIICCSNGKIFKSIDGGETWIEKNAGGGYGLYDLQFVDAQNAFAVGGPTFGYCKFLKSGDGGETWTPQSISVSQLQAVYFFNSTTGLIASADGYILRTSNNGADWTKVYTNSSGTVFAFYFIDQSNGYATAADNTILKTTDGGLNWDNLSIKGMASNSSPYALFFKDKNTGWVAGEAGQIFKTSDGGDNWTPETSNTTNKLREILFRDDSTGIAVGENGTFLTTNQELTILEEKSARPILNFNLSQNYPNPFNSQTNFEFQVNADYYNGLIFIKIYDIQGREVAVLSPKVARAGKHFISWNAGHLPGGVYYYQLQVGGQVLTKKMTLIK